jgi:hypothetical protein
MFRVEWIQTALDDLATIWMAADSVLRQRITIATQLIDQELQADPFRQSESRDDEERALFVYPLGVQFEVDLTNRVVWILHAWRFRRAGE